MSETVIVHPAEARRRFAEYAAGEIAPANLSRGALLIALEDYPSLDVDEYVNRLDAIAARVRERSVASDPAIFTLGHAQREVFDTHGFQGNPQNYYDARNSFLNEVIDRKTGIPITLSIVFLHVAHKAGLDAIGVGLPGHYVVKVRLEMSEIYIDPFQQGQTLTVTEIAELLSSLSGGQMKLRPEHLRGWSARETLMRVLANLQNSYIRSGDGKRAESARERIDLLARAGLS